MMIGWMGHKYYKINAASDFFTLCSPECACDAEFLYC